MKFSYNWLRDLVPGLATEPHDLMRLITLKTAECEGVEQVGAMLGSCSPAHVVSVEPIPGGHNVRAIVDTARYGRKTVVCGAPNCRPGLETVYVPLDAKVIDGVESQGMLASGAELEINKDHAGVLEAAAADLAQLATDHVIEVDNKSLTHRPDLWGHAGMAREVAAMTSKRLRDPVDLALIPAGPPAIGIRIEDRALCPRYSALVFENVTVRPSPLWLQYRLMAIGLNPINNIVDVTNLVMAELAQPTHAYDAGKLRGGTILVRPARQDERIAALNGETYQLSPANLVIADAESAVGIAGVIGGMESAISERTTRLVFESANFQAASIRKTSSHLRLRTDASMRFEKSQDPVNTVRGLARATELLNLVSPGIRLVGGLSDEKSELRAPPPIDLPIDWVSRKLGAAVSTEQVREILQALEFGVLEDVPGILSVTIPSWRATKDIAVKDDLLEEAGRMIGYDAIPPRAPLVASTPPPSSPERLLLRRVRSMATSQGFTEVSNYSFLSEDDARLFGLPSEELLRVANPIASGQTLLRTTLLPGMFRNIVENAKHFTTFRIFEIGRELRGMGETPHLVAVLYAREGGGVEGLFELKHLAGCLMPGVQAEPASEARAYEHPGRSVDLHWRGELAGRLFELHPSLGLEGRAAALDIDLSALGRLENSGNVRYRTLRRFPSSAFDLSVVTGLHETAGTIERRLRDSAGPDLLEIEFVRQYTGEPLPADRKSVSFRITVGSSDHTLSSEEVGSMRARTIAAMQGFGYELRV